MKKRALALLLATALVAPAAAVDIRDAFTRRMDEGIAAYDQGDFDAARRAFQDARVMRPDSAEAELNLGLTHARLGDWEQAEHIFSRLSESGRMVPEAHYNRGRALFDSARAAWESGEGDPERIIPQLIESIDHFNAALEAREGDFSEAEFNRWQAAHLLYDVAMTDPPPPQPEDQDTQDSQPPGEEGDEEESSEVPEAPGEGDSPDDPGEDDQGVEPEEGDDEDDATGEVDADAPPEDGDPEDGDPEEGEEEQDASPDDDEGEGDEQELPAAPAEPDLSDLSPEEARDLLNLLGDDDVLRRRAPSHREAERPW